MPKKKRKLVKQAYREAVDAQMPDIQRCLAELGMAEVLGPPSAQEREKLQSWLEQVRRAVVQELAAPLDDERVALLTVEQLAILTAQPNAPLLHGLLLARARALAYIARHVPEMVPSILSPSSSPGEVRTESGTEGERRFERYLDRISQAWKGAGDDQLLGEALVRALPLVSVARLRESLEQALDLVGRKGTFFDRWEHLIGAIWDKAPPTLFRVTRAGRELELSAAAINDAVSRKETRPLPAGELVSEVRDTGGPRDPAEVVASAEELQHVLDSLDRFKHLDDLDRHIAPHADEGATAIANKVGMTEGAIRKRLKKIRLALDPEGGSDAEGDS